MAIPARFSVNTQDAKSLILLYNPKVASPGYHRLPHSLLQLGALLEGRYPYAIVDGNLDQDRDHAAGIVDQVRRDGVRYLGVTMMPGPQLQRAVPDIKRIKAACPDLTIVVGGYFPSNHVNTCAQDAAVDYVVISAGEDTLLELVETLEAGGDPAGVAGLAFERGGKVIQTPKRKPRHPNDLPWFPYHKVPVEKYIARTHLGSRTLSHHSSFGCPFFCNFCAVVTMAEGKWLAESAERLGELMQHMVETWQIDAIEFHDNNFFTSEKRVAAFSEELLRRGLKIAWWGEGRIDTMLKFADRTWELMRDSGLKMVFMGAESGDDATLELMNKGGTLTADKTLQLAAHARKFDIVPEFSFILGNPPDSRRDIERGIEFIRRVKAVNPHVEIIMYRYDPGALGRRDVAGRARKRVQVPPDTRRMDRSALGARAAAPLGRHSLVFEGRPRADARLRDGDECLLSDHHRPPAAQLAVVCLAQVAQRLALPAALLPLAVRARSPAEPDPLPAPRDLGLLEARMPDILLTHGYFLGEDEKEQQIMKPYRAAGAALHLGLSAPRGLRCRDLTTAPGAASRSCTIGWRAARAACSESTPT